jgi:hypothetical protein
MSFMNVSLGAPVVRTAGIIIGDLGVVGAAARRPSQDSTVKALHVALNEVTVKQRTSHLSAVTSGSSFRR